MPRAQTLRTQAELARELNVSTRTIRGYLAEGMPGEPGRYVLDRCREWLAARRDMRKPIRDRDDGEKAESAWLEKGREWRAKLDELRYAKTRGELVEVAIVSEWLQKFAELLRGFGEKLALDCPEQVPALESLIEQSAQLWRPSGHDGPDKQEQTAKPAAKGSAKRASKRTTASRSRSVRKRVEKVRRRGRRAAVADDA